VAGRTAAESILPFLRALRDQRGDGGEKLGELAGDGEKDDHGDNDRRKCI
jgi:hypothetical protein